MQETSDNAMTWGERELKKSTAESIKAFAAESGPQAKKIFWRVFWVALALLLLFRTIYVVPPGWGGVRWLRFFGGTVHQPALREGLVLSWPWDDVYKTDLRVQDFRHKHDALSNDGLPVEAVVSLRYRVNPVRFSRLFQDVGPKYEHVLVAPVIGSVTREVISRYRADELYALARRRLEVEIKESVSDYLDFGRGDGIPLSGPDVRDGYVAVQDVAVLDVNLPKSVTAAIESKMTQDQAAQEYEFKLRKESMEAQRKNLEVQGIENYRRIATQPWFRDYMKYIEIQGNYQIANSPNAKLVFMANSGMPSNTVISIAEPGAPDHVAAKPSREEGSKAASGSESKKKGDDKAGDGRKAETASAPQPIAKIDADSGPGAGSGPK